jgi:hypothetical protein
MEAEHNFMTKEVKEFLLSAVSGKDDETLKFSPGAEFFFNEETSEIDIRVLGETDFLHDDYKTTIMARRATVVYVGWTKMIMILRDGKEVSSRIIKGLKVGDELGLHLVHYEGKLRVLTFFTDKAE